MSTFQNLISSVPNKVKVVIKNKDTFSY